MLETNEQTIFNPNHTLVERMKLVHNALNLNILVLRLMRWLVFLSATVGVTVIFFPLIILFFTGVVIQEGICVQYSSSIATIILFAVADFGLSSIMLALFVAPLTRHAHEVSEVGRNKKKVARDTLMSVARRNLVISSVMMSFTVASLFFMVYSHVDMELESSSPIFGHVQVLHTIFAEIDAFVNVLMCHVITVAWLPSKMKNINSKLFPGAGQRAKTSSRRTEDSNAASHEDKKSTMYDSARFNPQDKQVAPLSGGSVIEVSHTV
jgi:hypothetical protein